MKCFRFLVTSDFLYQVVDFLFKLFVFLSAFFNELAGMYDR
jgi:hypothetical protein